MTKHVRQTRIVTRREMLTMLGAAGATILAPCSFGQSAGAGFRQTSLSCVATPAQTEGPYFVDERMRRSDIRIDPKDGTMKEGVPLTLRLSVSSITKGACEPVAGAIVDIWHCDAMGFYSDVRDRRASTTGKKFLRGYQVTDANGRAEFTTIYPGWYAGRAVHIHFKVRTDPAASQAHELTSQLYFDDSVTDRVHARAPYAKRGQGRVRNEEDGIFRDGGSRLMLPIVANAQGYATAFNVALQMA